MFLSTHLFKVKITIAIQSWHLHSRACAKVTCHVVQRNQEASKLPYLYELLGLKVSFVKGVEPSTSKYLPEQRAWPGSSL